MLFCHLVDDYYLQGILASLKQKKWWEQNAPQALYEHDWKIALIEHAFSWTFVMMLPITICILADKLAISIAAYIIAFIANLAWHAFIDNLKANSLKINLWQDQVAHFFQIVITWICLVII